MTREEQLREVRRREIKATIRCVLIVLGIVFGAILLSSLLQSCTYPQVCRYCWVAWK